MTWLRFETDPAFHFDFLLAEKMGCTVAELRRRISQQEWQQWAIYYGRKAQQQEMAMLKARR